ncbi:AbiH family protein [Gillisia sp. JM1]|uniref:AbiH family protein n=1 Tax=Gillisia sp. JM1 TaxID=1283286 RepID=UPI0004025C93|nr:AbiH family protein [Gillisia sp. JM1]
MPKILITGNGFDLNFGLPTSYNDFINILNYIKSGKIDFDAVYSNSLSYDKTLSNFEKFNLDHEEIKKLINELDNNVWFDFFKNEYRIDSWIDFENRIEYVLEIFFTSLNYIKANIFGKGPLNVDSLTWKKDRFHNNIELIEVLGKFSILSFDKSYSVTFNPEFLIKRYNVYTDLDIEKITKVLYQELIQFKKIFNLYFEVFVFPFYDTFKGKINEELYMWISHHYTFNYTPTFEKLFNPQRKTSFLHGRINSKLNKIVIGINEIPPHKIDKKFFLPFTKYFQKLNNDTDYLFIKELHEDRSSNFMFFFYGHSLDKSDEDYINEVFDFVNRLKSHIKNIIVIYHNQSSKSKLLINLLNIRGKNDIQELMRSKILLFRHVDSKELQEDLKMNITQSIYI